MNPEALLRIEAVRLSGATKLDLSELKLEAISDGLADLVQLEDLNLDDNLLVEFPSWFSRLDQLQHLWIGTIGLLQCP